MTISWFKQHHGEAMNPRWLAVAAIARVNPVYVEAIRVALQDHASRQDARGSIVGFDSRDAAAFYRLKPERVDAIMSALREYGWLDGDRIANWKTSQAAMTDADRKRRQRERDRLIGAEQPGQDEGPKTDQSDAENVVAFPGGVTKRDAPETQRDQEGEGETTDTEAFPAEESPTRARGAPPPVAFDGRIVRVNKPDFDRWQETFGATIPDIRAELEAIDARLVEQGHKGQWFGKVTAWLRNKHERLLRERPANGDAAALAASARARRLKAEAATNAGVA